MAFDEDDDAALFKVVLNDEEQYSIWPAERDNALGWRDEGTTGTKRECLDHVDTVWTDMRPLSLRKQMEEDARRPPEPAAPAPDDTLEPLVDRLCRGTHPVELALGPEPTAERLKECLDRGYVHVKFTDTRGGTELGIQVSDESDLSHADFAAGTGRLHLVGTLTLDWVDVRCVADVDLATYAGTGRLEKA